MITYQKIPEHLDGHLEVSDAGGRAGTAAGRGGGGRAGGRRAAAAPSCQEGGGRLMGLKEGEVRGQGERWQVGTLARPG